MNEKLDGKFYGEIRKAKDNSIVSDDMWMCFLAKDNAFPHALAEYRKKCIDLGADLEHIAVVDRTIIRLNKWREDHPDLLKIPDAKGERLLG